MRYLIAYSINNPHGVPWLTYQNEVVDNPAQWLLDRTAQEEEAIAKGRHAYHFTLLNVMAIGDREHTRGILPLESSHEVIYELSQLLAKQAE